MLQERSSPDLDTSSSQVSEVMKLSEPEATNCCILRFYGHLVVVYIDTINSQQSNIALLVIPILYLAKICTACPGDTVSGMVC